MPLQIFLVEVDLFVPLALLQDAAAGKREPPASAPVRDQVLAAGASETLVIRHEILSRHTHV